MIMFFTSAAYAEPELSVCPLSKEMPSPPPRVTIVFKNEDGLYNQSLGLALALDGVSARFVFPAWSYQDAINKLAGTGHEGVWSVPDTRFCLFRCKEIYQETKQVLNLIEDNKWISPPASLRSWPPEYLKKLAFAETQSQPFVIHVETADKLWIHRFNENNIERSVWGGLAKSLANGANPINIRFRYREGHEATQRILHRLVSQLKHCKFILK